MNTRHCVIGYDISITGNCMFERPFPASQQQKILNSDRCVQLQKQSQYRTDSVHHQAPSTKATPLLKERNALSLGKRKNYHHSSCSNSIIFV